MNKLMLLIIAILLVGTITAISFGLNKTDFKEKVFTLSSSLFYDKLLSLNKISLEEIPKDTNLDLSNSGLEVTKNKEGVIRVKSK